MAKNYGKWLTGWTAAILLLIPGMVQKCGQANAPYELRMVGGVEPGANHPAAFSAVALVTKNGKQPICSGTIIAEDLIITAAHCIFNRQPRDMQVMFGRSTSDPNSIFLDVSAKDTFKKNQKYESNFDIGWVKIKDALPEGYRPIEIWHDPGLLIPGTPVSIAGYGRTATNCGFQDRSCQGGNLLAVETKVQRFVSEGRLYSLLVVKSQGNEGPCFGDSGGPAYVNYDGDWYLVGDFMGWDKILVNENIQSICDHGEGIYNYVGDFVHWIEASAGVELSYKAGINPRPQAPELPVLTEEPQNFLEWCQYSNHEDPAWYTVQRVIRVAAEGLLVGQDGIDPSTAFTDCEIAAETVETYIRNTQSLRLVGFDPEQNVDFARLEDIRPLRTLSEWGLRQLILADHSITDFTPLEELKDLETLEIVDNNLLNDPHLPLLASSSGSTNTDGLPRQKRSFQVGQMSKLKELRVNNANADFDFSNMSQLRNLEVLDLSFMELPDLQILSGLPLRELRLEDIKLARSGSLPDLPQLRVLSLRFLNVTSIPFTMPKLKTLHLWELPNLENIRLSESKELESIILFGLGIQQLPLIDQFPNLKELAVIGNSELESLQGLSNLPNLENLDVMNNALSSLGKLSGLPKLKQASFHNNQLTSLELQEVLPALEDFELSFNQLRDTDFLRYTPQLRFLDLSHNPELDISGIKGLSNLVRLALENKKASGLTSLEGLANLPNLKEINVKNNSLKTLNELLAFKEMEVILGSHNFVTDIQALGQLEKLDYLEMIDNPLEQKDCPIEDRGGFCRFEWFNLNLGGGHGNRASL